MRRSKSFQRSRNIAQQERRAGAQRIRAGIQQFNEQEEQSGVALCHDMSALQQEAPDLVGQRGAPADQASAHPVQSLNVELLLALEFDEAHGRPGRRFGDRFGIPIVVLLSFDLGPYIFRRHQPYLVPQCR